MTMTNASSSIRGRRIKFTPQAIEEIKEWVAEGISRDEIANRLGVTVGSLQVSLRRIISANGSGRHTTYVRRGIIPTPSAVDIVRMREQKEASQPAARVAPVASFAIMMRYKGEEQATDIPLSSDATEALALEAMLRDLGIADLVRQVLVAAIDKHMIHRIFRD